MENTVSIQKITTENGLQNTARLAEIIWRQHFHGIISDGQIEYMLDKFQSFAAMCRQVADENYEYYGIFKGAEQIGYYAVCEKPDNTFFLSKLYIVREQRGNGYASEAFRNIIESGRERGCTMVWLTVNKHNDSSIAVYRHWGMEVIREEVTDIGSGYVMDDYVFGFKL